MASSDTNGARPMSMEGRLGRERERMIGMTPEERAWRKRFVEHKILPSNEPIVPENFNVERYNPLRRFYRWPMDQVEKALVPTAGETGALFLRYTTAKLTMTVFGMYAIWYYFKYNKKDWTRTGGWKLAVSKPAIYPGDKEFATYRRPQGKDYCILGFDKSPI